MSNSLLNTPSAMAIANSIEQMRHEHLSLERYLGLHKDRQQMEAELTDFYKRNGVPDVSPEMIEKAVAAWKRDRFKFGGWQGSELSLKLAEAYLWFQPRYKSVLAIGAVALVASVAIVSGYGTLTGYMDNAHRDRIIGAMETDVSGFQTSLEKLNKEIAGHQAWLARFDKTAPGTADLLRDQLTAVRNQLAVMIDLRDEVQNWSKDNLDFDLKQVKLSPDESQKIWQARVYPHIAEFRQDLEQARGAIGQKVSQVEALQSTSEQLVKIRGSSLYAAFSSESDVAFKLSRAEMDFSQGRLAEARQGLNQLNQLLQAKQNTKGLEISYYSLVNQVEPIFKDAPGRVKLAQLLAQAKIAVKQGDNAQFSRLSDQISNLADYVATPLHLEVINRPELKSGLERDYKSKDGKSSVKRWFLVVKAVDPSGSPRKMDIFDFESNTTEQVSKWAQEVTFQGYEKLKKDKQADGIVDDTDVGDKLPGNYAFTYKMPMLTGAITSW